MMLVMCYHQVALQLSDTTPVLAHANLPRLKYRYKTLDRFFKYQKIRQRHNCFQGSNRKKNFAKKHVMLLLMSTELSLSQKLQ